MAISDNKKGLLTLNQAVILWHEIDPSSPQAKSITFDSRLSKTRKMLIDAVLRDNVWATIECKDPTHPYALGEIHYEDDPEYPNFPLARGPEKPTEAEVDWEKTLISRKSLARWARKNRVAPKFLWEELRELASEGDGEPIEFPEGTYKGYESPLLALVFETIDRYWINYQAGTIPKCTKTKIMGWLKKQKIEGRPLSDVDAKAIYHIARHPSLGVGRPRISMDE